MDEPYIKEGFGVAAFTDQTNVHPVGLAVLIVLGLATLFAPRRYAFLPMVLMAAFIPSAQKIAVFTLDFTFLRILVLCGFMRILARGEARTFHWQRIDQVLVAWVVVSFAVTMLRTNGQAFVNQSGRAFDAIGLYFLFRCLVRDWDDIFRLARTLAIISIPIAIAFLVEWSTRRNPFAFFGGVNEITVERQGRLRCQGPYSHPILSGVFWAVLLPIMVSQLWAARHRWLGVAGFCSAMLIVFCCASSTPVLGVVAAAFGATMFWFRRRLRLIRWGAVAMVFALHMVMQAPVWHLISRVSAVGGSTGWHRYHLIDEFINHFFEWALLGTNSTAHWGLGLFDVTNHYVAQGASGGVWRLGLFLWFMALAFGGVGRLWRRVERDRAKLALAWALGVAMFVQAVCFIGVTYFGQIILLWFMIPAIIGSLNALPHRVARPATVSVARRPAQQVTAVQRILPRTQS